MSATPTAPQVIRAGTLLDGTGAPAIRDGLVLIEGGKIAYAGPAADAPPAAHNAADRIDAPDATLLPGLIETHVHLTFNARSAATVEAVIHQLETDDDWTIAIRATQAAQACLGAGITTVRDCGGRGLVVMRLRDLVAQGFINGPRILSPGMPITTTAGHCFWCGLEADGEQGVILATRQMARAGADFIKVMATGGGLTPNTFPAQPQFDRDQMIALADDSRRLGRYVSAHCHGTPGIYNAIAANVRTIEHCSFMTPTGVTYEQEATDRIVEQGIYICPTLGAGGRAIERMRREGIQHPMLASVDARYENLRRMVASGAQIISGNDAGVPLSGFDDFQLDLEMLVEYIGMSAPEAIVTATGKAAEAIGSAEFGTLAAGKRADILAVRGDATSDIGALRNIALVLKSGAVMVDR